MRVLHVIPSISPKRGGPSNAVLKMVKFLRIEGIDASILTTTDNHFYASANLPISKWFFMNEVPIIMFRSLNSKFRFLREYLISIGLTWWLIRNISSYDALHVHSIFSYTSTISMIIARITKTPYIVRTIGQLNSWSLSQSKLRKSIMLDLVEKSNLSCSLAVHVTSNSELHDIESFGLFRKIFCLDLGVEYPEQDSLIFESSAKPVQFLFLSRIHPKKQLPLLLEACSLLNSKCLNKAWMLYIAGDGDQEYIKKMKSLSEQFGISEKIIWTGHVEGEDKAQLLRSADWFILPSASENFGISAVEALAYGVPVIITRDVGIADAVIEYGAGIICESNALNLFQILQVALQRPSEQMVDAARKLAEERYSWQTIAKKLALFYNEHISVRSKQ